MAVWGCPTMVGVVGVSSEPQGGATGLAAKAVPVEAATLSAPALHQVHLLPAEVTRVPAPKGLREDLSQGTLKKRNMLAVTGPAPARRYLLVACRQCLHDSPGSSQSRGSAIV